MTNNALCIKLANNYALTKFAMMHYELCIMH
mgnify:CR=1 FL=1